MKSPSYQWREISLAESYKLRALAILIIIVHNFLHLVMETPSENEFSYSVEKYRAFVDGLWSTPADCVRIIFSYLGHYGVQVFFFLSGYAAALKLSHNQSSSSSQNQDNNQIKTPPSWWSFVRRRLLSLYPAIIIASIGLLGYFSYHYGFVKTVTEDGVDLLRQMSGLSNFYPDNVYHPIGPWWFIGVILQFYLIAPLLYKLPFMNKDKRPLILGGIALSSLLLEYFFADTFRHLTDCNFNHCILGHLDICALGMLAAHYKKISIPLWIFALALLLFNVGNWYATMWIAAAFWMTIILVPLLRIMEDKLIKIDLLNNALLYIGQISIYIFLCNGYLRQPLLDRPEADPLWWKSIYYCLLFVIVTICWAAVSHWIDQKIRKHLGSKN